MEKNLRRFLSEAKYGSSDQTKKGCGLAQDMGFIERERERERERAETCEIERQNVNEKESEGACA